jgi:DNA phosphorothioation-dependent restriction protein DptH
VRYLADSIIDHIWDTIDGQKGTFRFVLPAYPSHVLVRVGEELTERAKKSVNRRIRFSYGIAFRLGEEWQGSANTDERKHFEVISEQGWYNESDNLTSLRNQMRDESTDCLISVLAGYELIHDKESLRDFFRLDQESIWSICLKKNFVSWIKNALVDVLNPDDHLSCFEEISDFFREIYDLGFADLVSISSYLEGLSHHFRGAMVGTDAYRIVLENLDDAFGLPNLTGILRGGGRKQVRRYISGAYDFFSYKMFLDSRARTNALKTIEHYWKERMEQGGDDSVSGIEMGPFSSLEALVSDLKKYIEERSEHLIPKIKEVDFAFILDSILGFRQPIDPTPKTGGKKIRGTIPEVFLNAVWDSLGRFKKEQSHYGKLARQKLSKISLIGDSFRHDFDSISDDDEYLHSSERAFDFLNALLGGLDDFLEERVLGNVEDSDSDSVEVVSRLLPEEHSTTFRYQRSMRAEPQFRFRVVLETDDGVVTSHEYIWPLPGNHHSRLVVSLYEWVNSRFKSVATTLPAFSAPFVPELFMARDEEEAARLLELCIGNKKSAIVDLLPTTEQVDRNEKNLVLALSYAYQEFARTCLREGFYRALGRHYSKLRVAYRDLMEAYLERSHESVLGPLLFKAFLLLPHSDAQQNSLWNDYLTGAIVTPLHPAMIDMMYHQSVYLCRVFSDTARQALKEASYRSFAARHFDRIVDLSRIRWPLYGILSDVHKKLDTNITSLGYVHMLGDPKKEVSKVGTKVLLEDYVFEEEDEIDDTGLFRGTRTSHLICQTLSDYSDLYLFAEDGVTIGAYCGEEIQPLIAGIDEYIKSVVAPKGRHYSLQLNIFSDGVDDSSILRWIDAWKDRWQTGELSSRQHHYENCDISIKYRVVARDDGFEQFRRIMRQEEHDIFYFMDFIKSSASWFRTLEPLQLPDDYQKFPVSEKMASRLMGGGKDSQRERVLSNSRFQLNALHAEVMASLQQPNVKGHKHVIISSSDFTPWVDTVDTAHECSAWVVCIDPSIDEQLLRQDLHGSYDREVIAFGTGVGSHGEKNFTISTDQFSMADIESRVATVISRELGFADFETSQLMASSLVREGANVAGLSIVKATGRSRFVRELVSNALVRKVLKTEKDSFCDELISLDAFLHWFDEPTGEKRPDLLRIRADIVNGHFDITLQMLECKLAGQFEGHLEKAREQIESGLRELVGKFKPRKSFTPDDYERPDQRYWWMQLHRLISAHGRTTRADYEETLTALERLSEGLFTVRWQAGIFAVWTDVKTSELSQEMLWQYQLDGRSFSIVVFTAGLGFVKRACLGGTAEPLFADVLPVCYSSPQWSYEKDEGGAALVAESDVHGNEAKVLQQAKPLAVEMVLECDERINPSEKMIDAGARDSGSHGFDRILLGRGSSGGRDAYWEFGHPDLPNRHILVFGASGTGKTYLIQALMCELAKLGRNTLVVDYTAGFTNKQLEDLVRTRLRPTQHFVKVKPLELNPFRRQVNYIDDMPIEEDPATIAGRVSGVFDEVYQLGDQQRSALYNAIKTGVAVQGNRFTLREMIQELERIRDEGGPSAAAAAGVISKVQPFVDTNPFGEERPESWEHLFADKDSRVHIIQLVGFMKNAARLITEFSLIDLYWYYRSHGDQTNPKVIVLDEIQNLSHKLESPLGQFLTEGRKFGISLILATQTLSNLDKDERDRLFQASHKVFFRPADTEIKAFAQILATSTDRKAEEWVEKLSTLKRGECYSLGYAYNEYTGKLEVSKYFRIRVKPLDERI